MTDTRGAAGVEREPTKQERRQRREEKRAARYQRGQDAQARIVARLTRVLDRIEVASQFRGLHAGTVAQLMHARRFARYGDNEDEALPPIYLGDDDAAKLVGMLAGMLEQAKRTEPHP